MRPATLGGAVAGGRPAAPFAARLAAVRQRCGPLALGLDPSAGLLARWGLTDDADGLERFVDVALEACDGGPLGIVKPQSAFFERHGWRGARALERLVAGARAAGLLVVLDVKRGDVGSTNDAYAAAYLGPSAPLRADAVTVSPYLGIDALGAFFAGVLADGAGLFVVVRSSNPEGRPLQEAIGADGRTVEASLLASLAARNAALHAAGDYPADLAGPYGAVLTANHPAAAALDLAGVGGLFLAPGLGAQGASVEDVAACFAGCADRVVPAASRSLLDAGPDVGRLREACAALGAEVRAALAG